MLNNISLYCRICGYRSEEPAWGDDGKSPTYDFCSCCGVEHGYQDSTPIAAKKYRTEWIASGAKWEVESIKPENWNINEQLKYIPSGFE